MDIFTAIVIILFTLIFDRWITVIVGAIVGMFATNFVLGLLIGLVLWMICIAKIKIPIPDRTLRLEDKSNDTSNSNRDR